MLINAQQHFSNIAFVQCLKSLAKLLPDHFLSNIIHKMQTKNLHNQWHNHHRGDEL